mgnify:CR=1 FL=1
MSEATPLLRLRGVATTYGEGETAVRALGGVDLDVHAGELVAIMGPSGAGKSTLLAVAGGLEQATEVPLACARVCAEVIDLAHRAAKKGNRKVISDAGVAAQVNGLVGQVQVPDDRVVEVLGAGGVDADVVGAPPAAELVAAGGQLSDQFVEGAVVGVASTART